MIRICVSGGWSFVVFAARAARAAAADTRGERLWWR